MDPNSQNQNVPQQPQAPQRDKVVEMLIPINRSGWAIAAGYVALFNFPLVFCAPIALVLGIIALMDIRKHPDHAGRGRIWFAIIYSAIIILLFGFILIQSLIRNA